ncbi:MAG: beta-L-arabinofuranosidase domain-containing protein [Prolixibacteraceae bacterium]
MKILRWRIVMIAIILLQLLQNSSAQAQDKLYTNEFELGEVTLMAGPFKAAEDLNIETLLKYNVDQLLEPFLTQAGLPPKGAQYLNWDGLAGHVGGHYLTALAMNYAATGNTECKARMEYMLSELKACQDANGNGYLGGVPNSKALWAQLKQGNFTGYNTAWVPWYNLHKTYAGLRDAWLYGNSETAKVMFLKLCDWGIDIISGLNDAQTQQMLDKEFGGMNEVYADAYQMTGNVKYLNAAKKFTHNVLFNSMAKKVDNLDNMHANTQIPKVIGFGRIAQLDPSADNYKQAAEFFWETVVNKRSLALGGNSRSEHFPTASACEDYTTQREGPESCNTYNMLKLTEDLFEMDPQAKYVDYYERALYNHILSTQHPEHGGYVYFTPARPNHYRVYSAVNQAMWCCVGSGMENHGKYGQFIYTHQGSDSLYLNLFIPSKLNWKQKKVTITQETNFPDEESTRLSINTSTPSKFKLFVRHPSWVKNADFEININGEVFAQTSQQGSFVEIDRTWSDGDQINIKLPMHASFEEMPNVSKYIAFMYGPILLGAKTGNQGLDGLVADDGRWGHIANGALMALNLAPVVEGNRDSILQKLTPTENKALNFTAPGLFPDQPNYESLVFEPFYRIHDSRYMMYWLSLSTEDYFSAMEALNKEEQTVIELDQRTIDQIATGEQQPDTDHAMKGVNTYSGVYNNEFYRDARDGGNFSYEMATKGETSLSLMVRYWGNEGGNRTFDILIDNEVIATENVSGKWKTNDFVNVEYSIPGNLLLNKNTIKVTFRAKTNHTAGGVYYLRLLKPEEKHSSINTNQNIDQLMIHQTFGNIILQKKTESGISQYKIFSLAGQLISSGKFRNDSVSINTSGFAQGIYILQYSNNGNYARNKIMI